MRFSLKPPYWKHRLLSRIGAARGRLAALPAPAAPSAAAPKPITWQLGRPPRAPKRLPPDLRSDAAFRGLIAANVGVWVLWQVAQSSMLRFGRLLLSPGLWLQQRLLKPC
jgi:hypothetical protein